MEFFVITVDCEVLGMIEAPDSASKVCFVQPQLSCLHTLKFTLLNLDVSRDNFTVLKIKLIEAMSYESML